MSASDAFKDQYTQYTYTLVEFTAETKPNNRCVDIVPCSWISYDCSTGRGFVSKFMPPPYDGETSALLHSLVKCKVPAPEDWPTYCIDIRGEARSYEEAVKKLAVLDSKMNAFSTDSEVSSGAKAAAAKAKYKMRVHQQNDDHQELWSVPPLEDLEDDENDPPLADVSSPNTDSDLQDARSSRNGLKRKLINQAKLPSGCKKFKANVNNMQKEAMRKEKEVEKEKHSTILFDDVVKVVNPIGSSEYLKDIVSVIEGAIKKAFSSHAKQITLLTMEIESLKLVMTQRSNQHLSEFLSTEDFAEKYNIHLPFKSLETFQDFDAQLKEDKELQKATKLNMWTSVDSKIPIAHSIRNVMKKYLSRNVIRQYTAVKETGTKLVFQKTALSSCIQDIIAGEYKKNPNPSPVTDKNFNQAVGAVINNSKDWEGHRSHRSKGAKADNEQAVDCAENRQWNVDNRTASSDREGTN